MRILLAVACALVVVSCGTQQGDGSSSGSTAPKNATGTVVAVDSHKQKHVYGFTLESEGETYEIAIAGDVDYGFPLMHLHEHIDDGAPVAVELEEREGILYALSIEDVP